MNRQIRSHAKLADCIWVNSMTLGGIRSRYFSIARSSIQSIIHIRRAAGSSTSLSAGNGGIPVLERISRRGAANPRCLNQIKQRNSKRWETCVAMTPAAFTINVINALCCSVVVAVLLHERKLRGRGQTDVKSQRTLGIIAVIGTLAWILNPEDPTLTTTPPPAFPPHQAYPQHPFVPYCRCCPCEGGTLRGDGNADLEEPNSEGAAQGGCSEQGDGGAGMPLPTDTRFLHQPPMHFGVCNPDFRVKCRNCGHVAPPMPDGKEAGDGGGKQHEEQLSSGACAHS